MRKLAFIASLFAGAGVFAWLIMREGPGEILSSLTQFGWLAFAGFLCISLVNFTLYSLRWQLILNSFLPKEKRLSLARMYMHRMAGFAMSYLTPAAQVGGEPVRIGMLMSDGVSGKKATSAVILDVAIELFAIFAFIIAGVILAATEGLANGNVFTYIAIGLGISVVILAVFFWALSKGKGFFLHIFKLLRLHKIKRLHAAEDWIKETESIMTEFFQKKLSLHIAVAALALIVIFFKVVEVIYIAFFLGIALTFSQAFLTATLPGIALILPVPGGLGIFEGGFAAVFDVLGIPLSAIAFALIIRIRDGIFIATGSFWMIRQGEKLFRRGG